MGAKENKTVADEMQKLGEQRRGESVNTMAKYAELLTGKPARTVQPDPQEVAQAFDTEGQAVPQPFTVPAQAPNKQAALATLLQARDPALQQLGFKELLKSPEYTLGERYNAQTGMKEKVLYDKNDPTKVVPFGGQEAVKGVAVNNTLVNPYNGGTIGKPVSNPYTDLLVPGANGQPVANAPLVGVKKDIAKSGASNTQVSVNTATKPFLTKIGEGVGEQVVNDFGGARSAVNTLNNVAQMESGLKNAIVGPAANARIKLAQIGEVMGVNGADTTEKLQNTRALMQGLARQELAAAGSMKGQGQITESERAILRKAESGQVDELTVPEIRTLMGALKKTANYRISQHNANLSRLKKDPNAAGVVDYMTLEAPMGGSGWSMEAVK
jgi:hypothetical protein